MNREDLLNDCLNHLSAAFDSQYDSIQDDINAMKDLQGVGNVSAITTLAETAKLMAFMIATITHGNATDGEFTELNKDDLFEISVFSHSSMLKIREILERTNGGNIISEWMTKKSHEVYQEAGNEMTAYEKFYVSKFENNVSKKTNLS